jgi:hypothetical protein
MSDRLTVCVYTASCTEGDYVMDTVSCMERHCVVGAVIGHVVCRLSGLVSVTCCSGINMCCLWCTCIKKVSQQFIFVP